MSPIKVEGFEEGMKNFERLQETVKGEALIKAALAGGHMIEAYAKINVNNTFGHRSTGGAGLAGSIITEIGTVNTKRAEANIGPTVIYGRIQELGGVIKPVFADLLSWINPDSGERIFANVVTIKPHPYLRPAVDEHEAEICKAAGAVFKKVVENAIRE